MDAAAPRGVISVSSVCSVCSRRITYSRNMLVNIRAYYVGKTDEFWCDMDSLCRYGLLSATKPAASRGRRKRKRFEKRQRRGKRAGVHARLKANPTRPAVPSLLFSNVRSIDNKLDELRLLRETHKEFKDCCVYVLTESWLHDNIPDVAIQLEGMTLFRADREAVSSGKSQGGGLCIYINIDWCVNATVAAKHCSLLAEFLIVKCRPFYLPREFTIMLVAAVYIARSANAKANGNEALGGLHEAISELLTTHPDSFVVIAGDFNHTSLKTVFAKFLQYVDFKTGETTHWTWFISTHHRHTKQPPTPILATLTTYLSY
ncbi:uncharacterized protein LOC134354363 [Mobula hypostoma]|uniref:uncharacterized protein LOC134354363 n=1 Tax=Mobula hypostoma TaxID=723540 RepID=UPI002FC32906